MSSTSRTSPVDVSTGSTLKVLIVDDDARERELYRDFLQAGEGVSFELDEADTGALGLERCESRDCVLLDYALPDTDGLSLIDAIRDRHGDRTAIVLMTGRGGERVATAALKAGAADYLPKADITPGGLVRAIVGAVEKSRLRQQIATKMQRIARQNVELQKQRDEIRRFYQNVSHEILTPLTSAQEFADILLDGLAGPLADEQREYVRFIRSSCGELSDGVRMLIELARIEQHECELRRRPFTIHEMIDAVIGELRETAGAKGIELRAEVDDDLPDALADPERGAQILSNLLHNAIRFTGDGGLVRVLARRSRSQPDQLAIAVMDSGRGIDESELERIFERLYQSDPSVAREGSSSATTGFGLGLTIARYLVEMQGGYLRVESELGVGSTFTFSLPSASSQGGVAAPDRAAA